MEEKLCPLRNATRGLIGYCVPECAWFTQANGGECIVVSIHRTLEATLVEEQLNG